MKYENFDQIRDLISKIKTHETALSLINCEPMVIIQRPFTDETIRIDTVDYRQLDMGQYTVDFLDVLRKDIQSRIDNLKSILETL